jgi:hypothetical protein
MIDIITPEEEKKEGQGACAGGKLMEKEDNSVS